MKNGWGIVNDYSSWHEEQHLPGWAGARKKIFFWTLWWKGRYHRQTHRQSGSAPLHPDYYSILTSQQPTSLIPHFYARCPSCHNPSNLSWLGTGTKYAGLHTQWLGWGSASSPLKFATTVLVTRRSIGWPVFPRRMTVILVSACVLTLYSPCVASPARKLTREA